MSSIALHPPLRARRTTGSSLAPVLRHYFRFASRVAPELARRQAERLFTTPPRPRSVAPAASPARRETVSAGRHDLAVWSAGPAGAPAVLLAHGWGGRGAQMGALATSLLAAGRRVVWFDQPGHGDSGRACVGLPDFVQALHALTATHGPFDTAVGHSLGGAAIGLALRERADFGRAVFIGAPASMREHTLRFSALIGISPRVREAMRRRIEHRYNVRFDDIDRIDALGEVSVPALFVHDVDDAQVPFEHALRLSAAMPQARLLRTWGLGHNRVLKDAATVAAITHFICGDEALPEVLPALPQPAPIY